MLVNGLPIPKLLLGMIQDHRWRHPGDEILRELIPEMYTPVCDPVNFLSTVESIERESAIPTYSDTFYELYKEGRGSNKAVPDLPWMDVEKRLFIAVCAVPGADVGIALDYRISTEPRVVALVFGGDDVGFFWTKVSDSFKAFVADCGLLAD